MISFGALLFSLGQAVIIRDYNRVDFHEFSSIEELHAVFFSNVDDEGNRRAVGNLVLGTATEACWNLLESPAFRGVQRHAGGIMSSATIPASKSPVSLEGDSCAELLFFRKGWLISEPSYRLRDEVEMREGGSAVPALSHMRVNEWLRSFNSISVHITNSFDFNVDIWWVEESVVPRVDVQDIPSSGAVDMQTFLGHTFAVKKAGTNEVVDYFAVDGGPYEMGPWNRIETCEFEPDSLFFTPLPEGGFDCTDMNWRLDEWVNTEWYALSSRRLYPSNIPYPELSFRCFVPLLIALHNSS